MQAVANRESHMPVPQNEAEYEAMVNAEVDEEVDAFRPRPPKVEFKAGVFKASGVFAAEEMTAIILFSQIGRVCFDEGTLLCASTGGHNGQWAARDIDPGPGYTGRCLGCPYDAWGSSFKGGRGKACADKRLLYVLTDLDAPIPFQMALPVTSAKPWDEYATSLRLRKPKTAYFAVETAFALQKETHPADQTMVYYTIVPKLARPLSPGELTKVIRARAELKELLHTATAEDFAEEHEEHSQEETDAVKHGEPVDDEIRFKLDPARQTKRPARSDGDQAGRPQ